jgi:hypothetical protein
MSCPSSSRRGRGRRSLILWVGWSADLSSALYSTYHHVLPLKQQEGEGEELFDIVVSWSADSSSAL